MYSKNVFERTTNQAMQLIARALAAGRLKTEMTGLHHIPKHGPVLLVARHFHHLFDGVALFLSIPRPIHILVTLEWVKSRHVHRLMNLATEMARWPVVLRSAALQARDNERPHGIKNLLTAVDRNRYQRKALRDSLDLLVEGRVLVIFPEGYPNIDPNYTPKTHSEELLPFQSGFAAIATAAERHLGARVPIIPTGLLYTSGRLWTVQLNVGEAVYMDNFVSREHLVRYLETQVAELSRLSENYRISNRTTG
jgi:1-acyl-sn-glycerol-3-phosphate acyltransferase